MWNTGFKTTVTDFVVPVLLTLSIPKTCQYTVAYQVTATQTWHEAEWISSSSLTGL